MADCRKKELMEQICQCEFILIDINLFLDTHPNNKEAIEDYNAYAEQLCVLKERYSCEFGPISNFGNSVANNADCFSWVKEPFFWVKNC